MPRSWFWTLVLGVSAAGISGAAASAPLHGQESRVRPAAAFLVERPSFGTRVSAVNDEARRTYGLTTRQGALVVELVEGGALATAGIPLGAVIVAADGRRIDGPQDLSEFVRKTRVGQEVELTYYEGAQLRRKRVRVASADEVALPKDADSAGDRRAPERLPNERVPAERIAPGERPAPERAPAERTPPERGQALKRLERALETLAPRLDLTPGTPDAPPPAADADLRAELAELRAEIVVLRRRLAELERSVVSGRPRSADPPGEDPNDDRPGLDEDSPAPTAKAPVSAPPREPRLQLGAPKLEAPANDGPKKPIPAPPPDPPTP